MKTLGAILLVLLAKGAAMKIMRDSVREQRNKQMYERMLDGQKRRHQLREDWRKRIEDRRRIDRVGRRSR